MLHRLEISQTHLSNSKPRSISVHTAGSTEGLKVVKASDDKGHRKLLSPET